jgi:hypothetical protein
MYKAGGTYHVFARAHVLCHHINIKEFEIFFPKHNLLREVFVVCILVACKIALINRFLGRLNVTTVFSMLLGFRLLRLRLKTPKN